MNNKEEVEKAWKENCKNRVEWINERIQLSNSLGDYIYFQQMCAISDFKAALIQAYENEVEQTLNEMEELRKDSDNVSYDVCQTKVNTLRLMIGKINETKPL